MRKCDNFSSFENYWISIIAFVPKFCSTTIFTAVPDKLQPKQFTLQQISNHIDVSSKNYCPFCFISSNWHWNTTTDYDSDVIIHSCKMSLFMWHFKNCSCVCGEYFSYNKYIYIFRNIYYNSSSIKLECIYVRKPMRCYFQLIRSVMLGVTISAKISELQLSFEPSPVIRSVLLNIWNSIFRWCYTPLTTGLVDRYATTFAGVAAVAAVAWVAAVADVASVAGAAIRAISFAGVAAVAAVAAVAGVAGVAARSARDRLGNATKINTFI